MGYTLGVCDRRQDLITRDMSQRQTTGSLDNTVSSRMLSFHFPLPVHASTLTRTALP
jgi:hypothetical protein